MRSLATMRWFTRSSSRTGRMHNFSAGQVAKSPQCTFWVARKSSRPERFATNTEPFVRMKFTMGAGTSAARVSR